MEYRKDDYIITDELEQVDLNVVMELLGQSYWTSNQTRRIWF